MTANFDLSRWKNILITQYKHGLPGDKNAKTIDSQGSVRNSYNADLILVQVEDSNRYVIKKDRYNQLVGYIITLNEAMIAKMLLLGNNLIPERMGKLNGQI